MVQVKLIALIFNYQNSLITRQLCLSTQQIRLQHNVAVATAEEASSKPTESEWDRARPFSEMPSPTVFTMIRNIGKYSKMDSAQIMLAMKKDYGEIFRLPKIMGRPSMVFTYTPDDFEKVFRNEGIWPSRPGAETLKHHREVHRADFFEGVEGIISTQGKKWGDFRTVVNPVLMQPKNVRLYFSKMSQVNWEFIQRIKDVRDPKTLEVPADFEEEINRWTLESVSVVALDKKMGLLGEQRDNPDAKLLFDSMEEFIKLTFELEFKLSLWKYIKTPKYKRLMKSLDNIQIITARCVNDAIARLEIENANNVEKPDSEKSVLEKLLKIDKKVAMVMAMDMLMAGVDTTSSTFTALMLCLAKNPEKQNKLREEIMQILPDQNSEFTEESMKNIPYLRACVKESMRMYPLITGNARIPQKDVVLSGFQVPKGTLVSMVALSLFKDEHYFPRAKEFLPERWLRPNKEDAVQCPNALKTNNPFTFLPFGFGPRSCIGKRIVDMELEMGVARIIRHFEVEFNHSTENAFKSLLLSVPNIPLKFKFTDLNK